MFITRYSRPWLAFTILAAALLLREAFLAPTAQAVFLVSTLGTESALCIDGECITSDEKPVRKLNIMAEIAVDFELVKVEDDSYQFKDKQSENYCLTANIYPEERYYADINPLQSVVLERCDDSKRNATQVWHVDRSKNGIHLINSGTEKCLTVIFKKRGTGHVFLFTCDEKNPHQRWVLDDTRDKEQECLRLEAAEAERRREDEAAEAERRREDEAAEKAKHEEDIRSGRLPRACVTFKGNLMYHKDNRPGKRRWGEFLYSADGRYFCFVTYQVEYLNGGVDPVKLSEKFHERTPWFDVDKNEIMSGRPVGVKVYRGSAEYWVNSKGDDFCWLSDCGVNAKPKLFFHSGRNETELHFYAGREPRKLNGRLECTVNDKDFDKDD